VVGLTPGVFPAIHRTEAERQVIVRGMGAAMKRLDNGPNVAICNPRFCSETITFSWLGGGTCLTFI
jgi:hypothetical protein